MRPSVLNPLFADVTSLKGIGGRLAKALERLAGTKVVDLVWHLPSGIVDRRYGPALAEVVPGRVATLRVRVNDHRPGRDKRQPYRVVCSDDSGFLTLVFFHARPDYLNRILPEGAERAVSGLVERFGNDLQMSHPDHIVPVADIESIQRVEPTYPLSAGITPKVLTKAIGAALERLPDPPEWQDPAFVARRQWPAWKTAVLSAHHPGDDANLDPVDPARERLAYDELLANQLALALVRRSLRKKAGRSLRGDGALRQKVIDALPFALTGAQKQSGVEIYDDMAEPARMLRLLQGDVGSGKTAVALLAMLNAVECGAQAAVMAPTEILARQHLATIEPLAKTAGIDVVLLTGREKGKARAAILNKLATGEAPLAVGTHALFQHDVTFKDLAFTVVDEQHRFGVQQRLTMAAKGQAADVLVMTATPIPRTLMMTAYGDMDVSRLTEKPPGRKPVDTRAMPINRLDDVVAAVRRAIDTGTKVFWVCPLVEESDVLDIAAAEERHAALHALFGDRVGLVHGRMKAAEKDAVMAGFTGQSHDILVATTVIEVGVDVPAASVMVVEHAERFGLAQLHQLRGRIGRGDAGGTCLLLYAPPLGETARARLQILRDSDDGFRIAEEDLRLRGAGELLGTRQSGLPDFRLAHLESQGELLAAARDDAALVINRDPDLKSDRGTALRTLLYLFERDEAVRYLHSG